MKHFTLKIYLVLVGCIVLTSTSCSKEEEITTPIVIEEETTEEDTFVALDPNLNDGTITFEETGPSFSEEDESNASNANGTWGRFGETGESKISLKYADNPSKTGINTSERVVQVVEPSDVQSWAGFFFNLEEEISFPSGQEAIAVQFYSPAPNRSVLLKLEDQLSNDDSNKKTTGDLFAVTTGTGWETLVFNIPEKNGVRSGIYNRLTMILGYGVTNTSQVTYSIDNIEFATPKEVVIAAEPSDAPAAPTAPVSQVVSIFSDAYTDVAGTDFNPNWGQSTVVTFETIASNEVIKYANLNYQGTQFDPVLDVSGKTKLHIDYFTGDATTLKFFLISPGSPAVEKSIDLNVTDKPGEWNSADIDLSYFSDVVDLSNIIQFKVEGTGGTVFFDNIYFYGVNSAPSTSAKTPEHDAVNVTSVFSDAYTPAVSAEFNPNWGQNTKAEIIELEGNEVLKYESLDFQGTDWNGTPLDVQGMEYLHFDYWTAEATDFNFSIISTGPKEKYYSPESIPLGQWVSVDVLLSDFSDVVDLKDLIQFKVDDAGTTEGATIYFDNLYFWKASDAATEPDTSAEAPSKSATDVLSIYSDTYEAAVTADFYPNWGQSTQYEEVTIGDNKSIKYSSINFQGIDWNSEPLDVTSMTHINFNYWTSDATGFDFFLVGGGAEKKSTVTAEKGSWKSVSIPLADFNDTVDLYQLIQIKIDVQSHKTGVSIYFDNIFFSK